MIGAPNRTRTCDPLIKSQLLYQLSYRRIPCKGCQLNFDTMICKGLWQGAPELDSIR
jgi:hypothetical protein